MTTTRVYALTVAVLCLIASSALAEPEHAAFRQLTSDPVQDGFPCWSPDGDTIVFSRIDDELGKIRLRRHAALVTRRDDDRLHEHAFRELRRVDRRRGRRADPRRAPSAQ